MVAWSINFIKTYIFSINACPNSEHFNNVAPSICLSRSYVTFFCFIVGTILIVLQDNILFFYTPSEILQKDLKQNEKVRLGGLVEENSVTRNDTKINFTITDLKKTIEVTYEGILPDLFREGQGAVIEGAFVNNDIFNATNVFAKHDENYMPASIKEDLKDTGYWNKKYKWVH